MSHDSNDYLSKSLVKSQNHKESSDLKQTQYKTENNSMILDNRKSLLIEKSDYQNSARYKTIEAKELDINENINNLINKKDKNNIINNNNEENEKLNQNDINIEIIEKEDVKEDNTENNIENQNDTIKENKNNLNDSENSEQIITKKSNRNLTSNNNDNNNDENNNENEINYTDNNNDINNNNLESSLNKIKNFLLNKNNQEENNNKELNKDDISPPLTNKTESRLLRTSSDFKSILRSEGTFFDENYESKRDFKILLINRNTLFRSEYKFLNMNIETSILYKNNKDHKDYKEYHLCLYKDHLILFEKDKKNKKKKVSTPTPNEDNDNLNPNLNSDINTDINNNNLNSFLNKIDDEYKTDEEKLFIKRYEYMYNLKDTYDIFNPVLFLNFDYYTTNISVNQNNCEIILEILSIQNFIFYLKVINNNKELLKKLYTLLKTSIINSKGYTNNLFGISLRKDFFKNYYMKFREFEYHAKTGDLLLFRSLDCASKMQRLYTRHEYDHVALLIKKRGILYVYEATSKDGCKQRPWTDFLYYLWNLLYEKMVYRRLYINVKDLATRINIQREISLLADLFVKETEKKKYVIKFCTICCGGKLDKDQKDNQWKNINGFNCSSLLAAAYLKMGILSYTKNVDSILPGHFAYKQQLVFNKPFELMPEVVIDFSSP